MRIGFVVNEVSPPRSRSTRRRAWRWRRPRRGHETWLMGVDDFAHEPDGAITAHARGRVASASDRPSATSRTSRARTAIDEQICVDDLDVLFMRNDPAEDATERPWAVDVRRALRAARGRPTACSSSTTPPASPTRSTRRTSSTSPRPCRPRTLISRDPDAIAAFVDEHGGEAVLKPLQGSAAAGVFLVSDDESPNLHQITEAILRDGYVVAQERLPGADDGDVRLFVMNGEPLQRDGAYAAFRRVNEGDDLRSNMHAGGNAEPVEVTDEMLALVDLARPKLVADGMFLVGLDIVGDKLMEVNVFSPGGLGSAQRLYDVDFADIIVEALERKVALRSHYGGRLPNVDLAAL